MSTQSADYTQRLVKESVVWWKRLLDVQAPYRWNIRRLARGATLDIGCGIGRNLAHLQGRGVGIDHNPESVRIAQERGLIAFTPDDFLKSSYASESAFGCLLLSHVAEHVDQDALIGIVDQYLPFVKQGGRLIIITPQEAGYRSDSTHVHFVDHALLYELSPRLHIVPKMAFSFPFPRVFGKVFKYNEFVFVGEKI